MIDLYEYIGETDKIYVGWL